MWKKLAISAAVGAAVLGAGGAAVAAASGGVVGGSPDTISVDGNQTPVLTAAAAADATSLPKSKGERRQLARALHATWVTAGKDGSGSPGGYVTHDMIRGDVTAVSATSITIKASDNVSQTYVVNSSTKVRIRTNGKGAAGAIGSVKVGDKALVIGTGTTTLTATGVVDVAAK